MTSQAHAASSSLLEQVIDARDMADAMSTAANKLIEFRILTQEGYAALHAEASRVMRAKGKASWEILIDRDRPITFEAFTYEKDKRASLRIVCAGMAIDQGISGRPPFGSLDVAIEVDDERKQPLARWHIDLANSKEYGMQPGPLFHLQYGGHQRGFRHLDHPLKTPRWSHPPMDIVLLCEVVAANFYTPAWEQLREDYNWCRAVSLAQRLCYSSYLVKMLDGLSVSSRTILHSMWAAEWA